MQAEQLWKQSTLMPHIETANAARRRMGNSMLLENKNAIIYGAGGAVGARWPVRSLAKVLVSF